jgi:hypothetical protein
MTSDNTSSNGGQKPPSGKAKVKRTRRPQTKAEKAARQDKRLRDQYGNSRLDPKEPPLHELTAAAILCALDLLRQAFRSRGGFKPKSIADKVASICSLPGDQHKLLLTWLTWVKPKRWVLQEEGRSAVVAWSCSRPDNSAVWTAALDAEWRARIESAAGSKKEISGAPDGPPQPSGQSGEAIRSGALAQPPIEEGAPRLDPNPDVDPDLAPRMDMPASHSSSDRTEPSGRPNPSGSGAGQHTPAPRQERIPVPPPSTAELIDRRKITAWPKPAFRNPSGGAANEFAEAALKFLKREGSEDALRVAAGALRNDMTACREFCGRSPNHRKFVESIFEQLGWAVP